MSRCGSWRICHAIRDASRAVVWRCKRKKQAKHVDTYMRTITASFSRLTVRCIEAQSCTGSGWYLSGHANQKWSGSSVSPLFSALIIGVSFQYADFIISQPDLHQKLLYAIWLLDWCYCWDHQDDGIPVGLERLCCVFIKTFNKTVVCKIFMSALRRYIEYQCHSYVVYFSTAWMLYWPISNQDRINLFYNVQ